MSLKKRKMRIPYRARAGQTGPCRPMLQSTALISKDFLLPLLLKEPLKKIESLENLDKHKHKQKIQESGCGCSIRAHCDL